MKQILIEISLGRLWLSGDVLDASQTPQHYHAKLLFPSKTLPRRREKLCSPSTHVLACLSHPASTSPSPPTGTEQQQLNRCVLLCYGLGWLLALACKDDAFARSASASIFLARDLTRGKRASPFEACCQFGRGKERKNDGSMPQPVIPVTSSSTRCPPPFWGWLSFRASLRPGTQNLHQAQTLVETF